MGFPADLARSRNQVFARRERLTKTVKKRSFLKLEWKYKGFCEYKRLVIMRREVHENWTFDNEILSTQGPRNRMGKEAACSSHLFLVDTFQIANAILKL